MRSCESRRNSNKNKDLMAGTSGKENEKDRKNDRLRERRQEV
jgi:hypothetical protein